MVRKQLLNDPINMLSPLEREVCSALWCSCGPCTCGPDCKCGVKVRDVFKRLKNKGVQTTVSSVAVVLDRLHSLGLLKRRSAKGKGGTHYFYSLKKSRSEFEQEMLERAIDNLLKTFGPKARAHLAARLARS